MYSFCSSMSSARVSRRTSPGSRAAMSPRTACASAPSARRTAMEVTLPSGAASSMSQSGSRPMIVAPAMEAP